MRPIALSLSFAATLICGHAAYAALPQVQLHTSLGDIVLEIDNVHAPITGNNFLALIDAGAYTGGTFYRSVTAANTTENPKSQLIQGGISSTATDAAPIMLEKTSTTGLSNIAGTISMARMDDPNSATSAIFINITNNSAAYDDGGVYGATGGYAVFGSVVSGMSVVTSIQSQPTDSSQDLTPPISIITGTRVSASSDGGIVSVADLATATDASVTTGHDAGTTSHDDAGTTPPKKSGGCSYAGSTRGAELPCACLLLALFALRRRSKTTAVFFLVATLSLGGTAFADSLPQIELHTSLGDIVVEIDNVHAPITGNNFLGLIDAGAYTGGSFYRTVVAATGDAGAADQLIQGGINATYKDTTTITLEKTSTTGLSNTAGTIAMARTDDPNSAISDFYFNISDNSSRLDDGGVYGATGGYAVFGHVVSGMSVVTTIQGQPQDGSQNLTPPITILAGVRVETEGDGGTQIYPDFGPGAHDLGAGLTDASVATGSDASVAPPKKSGGCSYAGSTRGSELPFACLLLALFALRRRSAA